MTTAVSAFVLSPIDDMPPLPEDTGAIFGDGPAATETVRRLHELLERR